MSREIDIIEIPKNIIVPEGPTAVEYAAQEAAQGVTINARRPAFPVITGNRINGFTHGAGMRTDAITAAAMGADQIRGSLMYLPTAITLSEIGIAVTTAIAASSIRLGIGDYNFGTRVATSILDAGTVDSSTIGDKTIAISPTRGPGWIILMAYFSHGVSVQIASPVQGYSYNTTGSINCTPVQTGTAFSAFSATESFNTNGTTVLSTWVVAA